MADLKMKEACSGYDVFINHRGPDTKNILASLLYEALHRLGLSVFLDRDELQTGDGVSPQIKAAIESSSVQIAIFSPRYAEKSTWCLDELCLMVQQPSHRSTIIPIFWDVEPSDVKYQKGKYAEALQEHKDKGRVSEEVVDGWKEALMKAAEISGHVFHTAEGCMCKEACVASRNLGKFVFEIVDIVKKKVRGELPEDVEHPVGLDKAAENLFNEISKQMNSSSDTTIVGIAGLAGSGKTTLVTRLCNLKRSHFEKLSFLCEVSQSESNLTSLQGKLLVDLRGCPGLHIENTKKGKDLLRRHLKGLSRVLIVLDDIDCQEQIDNLLLAVKDELGKGSLIVITARDKDILRSCEVSFLYNMKLLDEKDGRELFLHHAFRESKAEVLTISEDLVREMVKMCGGYPLALKVLGKQLFGQPERRWNSLSKKFQNEIVRKIVKPSHDSLDEEEKAALLLVASLFEGLDMHLLVRLEAELKCPNLDGIETLGQKSLVEFHRDEVDVHNGEHEFCIDHLIQRYKRNQFIRMSPYIDYEIGVQKFITDMAKRIPSEASCSKNKMISFDCQIPDRLQQLPKGTTVQISPKCHIVVDNCIQEFPQLKHLKYRLEQLIKVTQLEASYSGRQKLDLINDRKKYDVYLCFRGPDARNTLAKKLFQYLEHEGLHVFFDFERIEKGQNIEVAMEEAIKDSRLIIPIFSPGYAHSVWCLKELSLIWHCKVTCAETKIIPLFYNVTPWHVRYPDNEKSPYAEAFKMHSERRHSKEEIEEWKVALHEVSWLSGWDLVQEASGFDGFVEFILRVQGKKRKERVKYFSEKLDPNRRGYDVFLSFRGPDVRNTLVKKLFPSLQHEGLHVLEMGEDIGMSLEGAIKDSRLLIPIFSPGYADSPWCLRELSLMCRCKAMYEGTKIVPLFYYVWPWQVNHHDNERSPYSKAFKMHNEKGRHSEEEIEEWKAALREVSSLAGWVWDPDRAHAASPDWECVDPFVPVVRDIVDIVQKYVGREPVVVAEHPGLDKAANNLYYKILAEMEKSEHTTVVGIAGQGGSGKTTLVAHFYDEIKFRFRRFSFLCNVSQHTVTSLQEKLLFDLGRTPLPIGNTKGGKSLLQQCLRGLSEVLIVLDDIDSQEQIDNLLLAVKDVLGKGSLIVMTSRDEDLLARCESVVYDMKLLDDEDALQLFCHHAFPESQTQALTISENLVREMVKMCGGFPLALKVLGAQLSGKQKRFWELQLEKLQKNQFSNEIVEKIVKVSYDSLEEEAKEVFLDVASFFEGSDIHLLLVRLRGEEECPLMEWIKTLAKKCLVEFHCFEVDVHDGEHEDVRPYRDCKIGIHKFVKEVAKIIASEQLSLGASCSKDKMISSDYQIPDRLQQVPRGTTGQRSLKCIVVVGGVEQFPVLNVCFRAVEKSDGNLNPHENCLDHEDS